MRPYTSRTLGSEIITDGLHDAALYISHLRIGAYNRCLVWYGLRGFAKLNKFRKSKKKLDRAQPTHPPPYPIFLFWKLISDTARTLKSQWFLTTFNNV